MIKLKDILNEGPTADPNLEFVSWVGTKVAPTAEIVDYIFKQETFVPYTYDDGYFPPKPYDKTKGNPKGTLTIGYGTTDPKYAFSGNTITELEARKIALPDIQDAADAVQDWQKRALPTDTNSRKLTINMYRAMIDIVYNRGRRRFASSGFATEVELGNYKKAYNLILNGPWGHANRRKATADMFIKDGILNFTNSGRFG